MTCKSIIRTTLVSHFPIVLSCLVLCLCLSFFLLFLLCFVFCLVFCLVCLVLGVAVMSCLVWAYLGPVCLENVVECTAPVALFVEWNKTQKKKEKGISSLAQGWYDLSCCCRVLPYLVLALFCCRRAFSSLLLPCFCLAWSYFALSWLALYAYLRSWKPKYHSEVASSCTSGRLYLRKERKGKGVAIRCALHSTPLGGQATMREIEYIDRT